MSLIEMIDCEKTILVIDPEETVPSGTGEEHLRVTNEANNRTPLLHKYKYTQLQTQKIPSEMEVAPRYNC